MKSEQKSIMFLNGQARSQTPGTSIPLGVLLLLWARKHSWGVGGRMLPLACVLHTDSGKEWLPSALTHVSPKAGVLEPCPPV